MSDRSSLRFKILYWLGVYALLLTAAIVLHGYLVNERAEQLVWESLLHTELDHHLERTADDPGYRWTDTDNLKLYATGDNRSVPVEFSHLVPGVHDELEANGRQHVVLVERLEGRRYILSLDITELEEQEMQLSLFILSYAIILVLSIGAIAIWGLRRVLRPLSQMAGDIARLEPDRGSQRILVDAGAGSELVVISGAINDYLARHERFVERERVFIDTASHELRTPMAVIAGATELALNQPGLPEAARAQVLRAHRSARSVEQLISLLLVLAKDPGRLSKSSDRVELDELVREIVDDHHYLTEGKDLVVKADELARCEVTAPIGIVQAAIGNLLRNAIENSDQGVIRVRVSADATVTIEDPGHGMTPEEISRIYAQIARGGGRDGGGIGLDLLGRLCEHLGWRLRIDSVPGRSTTSVLELRGDAR